MTFLTQNKSLYCSQNFLLISDAALGNNAAAYVSEISPLSHRFFLRPQRAESGSRCKVCPQKSLISIEKGALELLELLNKG